MILPVTTIFKFAKETHAHTNTGGEGNGTHKITGSYKKIKLTKLLLERSNLSSCLHAPTPADAAQNPCLVNKRATSTIFPIKAMENSNYLTNNVHNQSIIIPSVMSMSVYCMFQISRRGERERERKRKREKERKKKKKSKSILAL